VVLLYVCVQLSESKLILQVFISCFFLFKHYCYLIFIHFTCFIVLACSNGRFRAGVKDLEVMTQNLITSAFETVSTVVEGVMLLDVFQHLSARESIKRTVDKKTVDVCARNDAVRH